MRPFSVVAFAFLSWTTALAMPYRVSNRDPIHVPILRHGNDPNRVASLPMVTEAIKHKYGVATSGGGSSSYVPLTDEQNDVSYSGVVRIGTPAQDFNVILDTGSSDLCVATTACTTCASGVPLFDPSESSTYEDVALPLSIGYGPGVLAGYVFEDTVTFGNFTLQHQRLLSVDATTIPNDAVINGLSGIMGLGFQSISALQTPPFWQALYDQNLLSQPLFGFYLERRIDRVEKANAAPGGSLTLGGTNASLYAGDVEFIGMPNGTLPSYWFQQVRTVKVLNTSIDVPNDACLAAIDTGTTLIGAPSSIAEEIWSAVPGSLPLTDEYEGMYAFPCTVNVTVSLSFGGTSWAINAADMNIGTIDLDSGPDQMCVGGIFDMPEVDLGTPSVVLSWVVGSVFLKNVYSVFRAEPPAVGFAQLADGVESLGGSSTSGSVGSFLPSTSLTLVAFLLSSLSILI